MVTLPHFSWCRLLYILCNFNKWNNIIWVHLLSLTIPWFLYVEACADIFPTPLSPSSNPPWLPTHRWLTFVRFSRLRGVKTNVAMGSFPWHIYTSGKRGTKSFGTGVMDSWEPLCCMGTKNQTLSLRKSSTQDHLFSPLRFCVVTGFHFSWEKN